MNSEFSAQNLRNKRIQRAVEVSAQMFLRDGIEAVKMTDIANESGIGVATLYRYFRNKTGITIAAMTHLWNELKNMNFPVLLLAGELDKKFVQLAHKMHKLLNLSQLETINDTGHAIHVEEPKIFGRIVSEFIRGRN